MSKKTLYVSVDLEVEKDEDLEGMTVEQMKERQETLEQAIQGELEKLCDDLIEHFKDDSIRVYYDIDSMD